MRTAKIGVVSAGPFRWNVQVSAESADPGHPGAFAMEATVYGSHRRALRYATRLEDRLTRWLSGVQVMAGGAVARRALSDRVTWTTG